MSFVADRPGLESTLAVGCPEFLWLAVARAKIPQAAAAVDVVDGELEGFVGEAPALEELVAEWIIQTSVARAWASIEGNACLLSVWQRTEMARRLRRELESLVLKEV